MTTKLEQEFFNVFGIEPIPIKSYGYWLIKGSIAENDKGEKVVYPEITDRKLLEMICIMNKHIHKNNENALCPIAGKSREEIKNYMLRLLNFNQPLLEKNFIKEIQQLFKGEQ